MVFCAFLTSALLFKLIFSALIVVLFNDNFAFEVYVLFASLSATATKPPAPIEAVSFTIALLLTSNLTSLSELMSELFIFVVVVVLNSFSILS